MNLIQIRAEASRRIRPEQLNCRACKATALTGRCYEHETAVRKEMERIEAELRTTIK